MGVEQEYVLKYLTKDLQLIDNMLHGQDKYSADLLKVGKDINGRVTFEQFQKLFHVTNDNYYLRFENNEKFKLLLIVIYNMF